MVLLDHFRPPLSSRRHWHAFHNAWATYLATDLNQKLPEGFSLVVVDVVTTRKTNLHRELLNSLVANSYNDLLLPNAPLYAAAYHPRHFSQQAQIDVWYETFDVGAILPTMPLWLDADLCVPLMLQETYEQTCKSQRIYGELNTQNSWLAGL